MPSHPPTKKHVAESKTRLSHSLLLTTETFNSNNHPRIHVRPTHIRTRDPSTVIQSSPNTFATILAPEVFLERPITWLSTTNHTPLPTVDSVGEFLPLPLVLHFRTIVIVTGSHKSSHHLPDPPGQEVVMMLSHLFNKACRTHTSLLPTICSPQVRRSHYRNPLTRTNTSITTSPTNLRSATGRGMVDHTQGRTIPWNEMSPITLPLTRTLSPSHLPGLRDLHRFKHRPFPVARSEIEREFTITRGSALRRT